MSWRSSAHTQALGAIRRDPQLGNQVLFLWMATVLTVCVVRLLAPGEDLNVLAQERVVSLATPVATPMADDGQPVRAESATSAASAAGGFSIPTATPLASALGTPAPGSAAGLVRTANFAGRLLTASPPSGPGPSVYDPAWASVAPLRTLVLLHDGALSNKENGDLLQAAAANLLPGDTLKLGPGTWKLTVPLQLTSTGSPEAPLRIEALTTQKPVIKRSDILQGLIEIGGSGAAPAASYIALRGLTLRGGDVAVRIHKASEIWIDRCQMRNTGGGVNATSEHSDHLYITRNDIHDTESYGEGVALGKTSPNRRCTWSIVALNHIHDTQAAIQGDGIDITWQSYGNWIAENVIHGTKFPSIIFHGTNGNPRNIIERNICYDSGDNLIQAESGEAIVRNNLLVAPAGNKLFDSSHNSADLRDLEVTHNTMIGANGYGAGLFAWNGQPGLVFANNVVYINDWGSNTYSIAIGTGQAGGDIRGNMVFGKTKNLTWGHAFGSGLGDFGGVSGWGWTYDAEAGRDWADCVPAMGGALISSAVQDWIAAEDFTGALRTFPTESGALIGDG